MPGGVRELRRRIRAIQGTQQLTRAMKMIATARLGAAEQRLQAARAYSHAVRTILADLAAAGHTPRALAALLSQREVKRDLYVVFASDRGLCGSFNHNLVHVTLGAMDKARGAEHLAMPIGRRGLRYLRRLDIPLTKGYTSVADEISYTLARAITTEARQLYTDGKVDEVFLVFSKYINPLVQRPTLRRLLPLAPDEWVGPDPDRRPGELLPGARDARDGLARLYEYLPSSADVIDRLIPRFLEAQVYWAAIQSKASEHGARLTAMGAATENAEDMLRKLTLSMHRARQTHITAELAEIVSGISEANEV